MAAVKHRPSAALVGGQRDARNGPLTRASLYREFAAMRFDQAFGDRQAQTRATIISRRRRLCLSERLQGALQLFLVHADTMILELHDGEAGPIRHDANTN